MKVAVLLGADPVRAASELRESLLFEIKLANASLPREQRRNASKLYNPMKLSEMSSIADIVDWTSYVNNVLTEDLLQVLKLIWLTNYIVLKIALNIQNKVFVYF